MAGILYLCATPIGNLEDITLRCIRTLKEVDVIAAEDTRQTIKLLNHFEIKKHMISYHEHNKFEKGKELVGMLLGGQSIALVSDAGMPAISDPGEDLVKLCIESNIDIVPIPGASASLSALIISGLSTRSFCFEGFLSANKKEKKEKLQQLARETRTIILYESPHRIKDTLLELQQYLGDRKVSVSRELTKKFEETIRGSMGEVYAVLQQRTIKGEFVIVVEGIDKKDLIDNEVKKWHNITVEQHILMYIEQGMDKKEAVKKVAEDRNLPKKEVYIIGCNI
ncbi:MAG: Uroporphyrin-III C/tetrapyrrole (Corrin/Porphyrin) methyltransferase [Clostridia bacterium]|jgi:16S rRNA (cytidine1402-2'-O)-methyltransferase|nr:Uroporphyrin-III C/tetrapyrrole (Corrin/Porphyrin) methyltransferase [Clostridia bacterium]